MRLPVDVEADHEVLTRGRASGQMIINYHEGKILSVDVRQVRRRAPRTDDQRPPNDDTRPLVRVNGNGR